MQVSSRQALNERRAGVCLFLAMEWVIIPESYWLLNPRWVIVVQKKSIHPQASVWEGQLYRLKSMNRGISQVR